MGGSLYFISGPTAVGKTELSLRWALAQKNGAEILSCDSLLVYKGLDIGTAKPSKTELAAVPHHGIDLVEPNQQFTIVNYVAYCEKVVKDVLSRGKTLLVTGGSGFYLKSFFAPVLDPVEVPERVSQSVRTLYREQGLPALLARVKALNPDGMGDLETQNPRRVVRALERCIASGRPLPELQEAFKNQPTPYGDFEKRVCLLTRDSEVLKDRIRLRAETMVGRGLVEEVRAMLGKGLAENASAARAIGYRETIAYIEEASMDTEDLVRAITANTYALVKKQRTWLRKQIPVDRTINLDETEVDQALDSLFEVSSAS